LPHHFLANPVQVRELQQLRSKLAAQDAANVVLCQMEQKATAAADAARAELRQLQDSMAPLHAQIRCGL
jgi:NADH/NAD ratio-sensing transcriptional regulator Rex